LPSLAERSAEYSSDFFLRKRFFKNSELFFENAFFCEKSTALDTHSSLFAPPDSMTATGSGADKY
jgi:hypothetical protein